MKDLINLYIADHALSWAPTTLKTEKHRLYGRAEQLNGNAEQLWASIQHVKPYTRMSIWTRVCNLYTWLIDNGHYKGENEYEKFKRKNARLFKRNYQPKRLTITYEEAAKKIKTLRDDRIRQRAFQLLGSGERWCESEQRAGSIIGKGNKRRNTYRPDNTESHQYISYWSFRRGLQAVGLTPHDLRKLFATRLIEMGAKEADLLELMGWSSIATAKIYLQPKKDSELKSLVQRVQEGLK